MSGGDAAVANHCNFREPPRFSRPLDAMVMKNYFFRHFLPGMTQPKKKPSKTILILSKGQEGQKGSSLTIGDS